MNLERRFKNIFSCAEAAGPTVGWYAPYFFVIPVELSIIFTLRFYPPLPLRRAWRAKINKVKGEAEKTMIYALIVNFRRIGVRLATPYFESFVYNILRPLSIRLKSLWKENSPEEINISEASLKKVDTTQSNIEIGSPEVKFDEWGEQIDAQLKLDQPEVKFDEWGEQIDAQLKLDQPEEINISEASLKKVDTTQSNIEIGSPAVKSDKWDD